jgi:DNA-binding LacI/PurR family transcriptional regulator
VIPSLKDVSRESRYCLCTVQKAFSTDPRAKGSVSLNAGMRIMAVAERIGYLPRSQRGKWAETLVRQVGGSR